jgi:DNA processing protein
MWPLIPPLSTVDRSIVPPSIPRVHAAFPPCYGKSATQKKGMELRKPIYLSCEEVALLRPTLTETRFAGLYLAGTLEGLAAPSVAIVGSRAPSNAGHSLARGLAAQLGRAGVCVISGLALGIDCAAHLGALEAESPTIGVLGGGHRCFHPQGSKGVAERMIAHGGGVISPYSPDTPARPQQFIQRNAIIAALADAVVVVEAARRSGSLNTAGWAADLGVPVFAFPGDVDRPKVAGCLALIRDGAILVRDADDVLEGIGLRRVEKSNPTNHKKGFTPLERALIAQLHEGEAALDELLGKHANTTPEINTSLVQLELRGIIERRAGGRFGIIHQ